MTEPIPFALFRNNFLPPSETFIHDELRHHVRYRATVFARLRLNPDRFTGHRVLSLDQGLGGRYNPRSLLYLATGMSREFLEELARGGYALLHAHFGHNGLYALPYSARLGLPLVVSLHGRDVTVLIGPDRYNPAFFYYTARKSRLFERATLFLAASRELKELVVEAGCPAEKVVVHRLGIDLASFSPSTHSDTRQGPSVIMVGRFVEKKGFRYGIRAFASASKAKPEARLILVGSGPEEPLYRRMARDLGIEDRVRFAGVLPPAEVSELMAGSAAVMTPSVVAANLDRESGLIVAKEGSASGLPVIGTWHGGIPDIVEDGVTGFLVQERDAEAMAERLVLLLTDPDRRLAMGLAGRAKMEREYDIRRCNEALEEIYDSVSNR